MYCLKCKQKTDSKDVVETVSSNNRRIIKSVCSTCGRKKSQFIASKSGKGVFNKALKAVGNTVGELHLPASRGEYIPNGSFNNQNKYSYCGPGTKYEQRNREGYQGINELDRMCKLHDQFYNENTDTASRNISDEALAHRTNEIANDSQFDEEQRKFARFVVWIMKQKVRFGLGVETSKNSKRELGPLKN